MVLYILECFLNIYFCLFFYECCKFLNFILDEIEVYLRRVGFMLFFELIFILFWVVLWKYIIERMFEKFVKCLMNYRFL